MTTRAERARLNNQERWARSESLIEDVEYMLDTGCTDAEIVVSRLQRAGHPTTFDKVQRMLHRHGRYDLSQRFTHWTAGQAQ